MQRELPVVVDRPRGRISLVELIGVVTLSGFVLGALLYANQGQRDAAMDRSCIGNLHGIRMALQMYQDQHGTLPPAYLCDRDGTPMHSWRVLILPQLGRQDLYRRYHFDEPWNSRHNLRVAGEVPDEYRCQADADESENDTNYVAVVGEGTVWPGSTATRISKSDQRIAVAEVVHSKILWTEPRDLELTAIDTLDRDTTPSLATHHEHGLRFSSLDRLIILSHDFENGPDAKLLRELSTDGTAFGRLRPDGSL